MTQIKTNRSIQNPLEKIADVTAIYSPNQAHSYDLAEAIRNGEIMLSLSPLLGCDYVFLFHADDPESLRFNHLTTTLREIIVLLKLHPKQCTIVSVKELNSGKLIFSRYSYTWQHNEITRLSVIPVTHSEQADFMNMMFSCSSIC